MEMIFVAALKEETPELSKFHHTGVGKINAAIKLIELIPSVPSSKCKQE